MFHFKRIDHIETNKVPHGARFSKIKGYSCFVHATGNLERGSTEGPRRQEAVT